MGKAEAQFRELRERLLEIQDLKAAAAVLEWDQATYMPPGGGRARARQIGTLNQLAHAKFVDGAIGKLLDGLRGYEESLPYESDEASLIRVTRSDYERAIKVPAAFMAEYRGHMAESFLVWTKARPADDFTVLIPYLEKMIDLSRQFADFFPGYEHVSDPLLAFFAHEELRSGEIRWLFARLRAELVPMVNAIAALPEPDDSYLRGHYPQAEQLAFGLEAVTRFGYDLARGREDLTHHPFSTTFSWGDVRITTRVRENDLRAALFGTLHEGGHALYEQGISPALDGTPLAEGVSHGLHESQSRLWENVVGRSWEFWQYFYPRLQTSFPEQLDTVPLEAFVRAINKVKPSLIRVEADEVTYNLHIMLRFDLEQDLLAGRLAVRDVPEAYRARFAADMGFEPPDDRDGVLQDMHWFGYFFGAGYVGYTLGNILSAAIWEAALADHPEIPADIAQGRFGTLHGWLIEHVYRHGRKFSAPELIKRATGGPLTIEPYARYLGNKFGALYRV